jgi:hypothetical protein
MDILIFICRQCLQSRAMTLSASGFEPGRETIP